jgi:hypothetical protein
MTTDADTLMKDLSSATGGEIVTKTTSSTPSAPSRRRRQVPAAIQEVVAIGVGARYDETLNGWVVPGFYRAKGLLIRYDEKNTQGTAVPLSNKRIQGQPVKSFDDLVELNYAWWNTSRKESLEFEIPEDGWKEEFVDREMVERRMLFIPKSKTYNPMREQS